MKKTQISIAFFISIFFSFSSCNLLDEPIESYLKKYTNEITIGSLNPTNTYQMVEEYSPNICISSLQDYSFDLFIANPQNHSFEIEKKTSSNSDNWETLNHFSPDSPVQPYFNDTRRNNEDPSIASITFSKEYLQSFDSETENNRTANGTRFFSEQFRIHDLINNQTFDPFTISFAVNTPPSIISEAVIAKDSQNSKYVICFKFLNFENQDKIFDDLIIQNGRYLIKISGTTYYFTKNGNTIHFYNDSTTETENTSFSQTPPQALEQINAEFDGGSGSVYFTTQDYISSTQNKNYIIELTDKHGVYSSYNLTSAPSEKPQLSQPEIIINNENGIVTLIQKPFLTNGEDASHQSDIQIKYRTTDTVEWVNYERPFYIPGGTTKIEAKQTSIYYEPSFTKTQTVNISSHVIYVDETNGNQNTQGGLSITISPLKDIQSAIDIIEKRPTDTTEWTIKLLSDVTCTEIPSDKKAFVSISPTINNQPTTTKVKIKITSNDAAKKVINSNNKGRVIYAEQNVDLTLDNLKITGGLLSNSGECGAGISFTSKGDLTISNCDIYENTNSDNGAGIYYKGTTNSNFSISYSNIYNNKTTSQGGGLYIKTLNNIEISNCQIYHNEAQYGGGIAVCYSNNSVNVTLKSTTVGGSTNQLANSASIGGGGIYVFIENKNYTKLTLQNSKIGNSSPTTTSTSNNYANKAKSGGGIYITSSNNNSFTLQNSGTSYINYNYASTNGGGIYCSGLNTIQIGIPNINYNYASTNGSAIYLDSTVSTSSINDSCSFVKNYASTTQASIYAETYISIGKISFTQNNTTDLDIFVCNKLEITKDINSDINVFLNSNTCSIKHTYSSTLSHNINIYFSFTDGDRKEIISGSYLLQKKGKLIIKNSDYTLEGKNDSLMLLKLSSKTVSSTNSPNQIVEAQKDQDTIYIYFNSDYTLSNSETGNAINLDFSTLSKSKTVYIYGNGYCLNANRSSSKQGSVIYAYGSPNRVTVYIYNLKITGGYTENGGGIYMQNANVYLNGSTSTYTVIGNETQTENNKSNYASSYGGGIYVGQSSSLYVYEYIKICDNYAGSNGGGIYVANGGNCQIGVATVIANEIENNTNIRSLSNSTFRIIQYNTAQDNGGGIYCNGQLLVNATVQYNHSKHGAGIYLGTLADIFSAPYLCLKFNKPSDNNDVSSSTPWGEIEINSNLKPVTGTSSGRTITLEPFRRLLYETNNSTSNCACILFNVSTFNGTTINESLFPEIASYIGKIAIKNADNTSYSLYTLNPNTNPKFKLTSNSWTLP